MVYSKRKPLATKRHFGLTRHLDDRLVAMAKNQKVSVSELVRNYVMVGLELDAASRVVIIDEQEGPNA
jgi:hypothetical protein